MRIATDYMSAYIAYARGDFHLGQVVYACNGNNALFRPYPCVLSVNDRPIGPDLFAKPKLDDFWFIIPLELRHESRQPHRMHNTAGGLARISPVSHRAESRTRTSARIHRAEPRNRRPNAEGNT